METGPAPKFLRPKWQYPPSMRIIQLPRRPSVRKKFSNDERRRMMVENQFFAMESSFGRNRRGGRAATAASESEEVAKMYEELDKRRLEVEMLRAECYMLRAEKEIATKKTKRIERNLRSAVDVLLAKRERISEGDDVSIFLEEEIDDLVQKLQILRRPEVKDSEANIRSNFLKQASLLKRRLERLDGTSGEICSRTTLEMAKANFSVKLNQHLDRSCDADCDTNMEILRKKMEGLSEGDLLEKMEKEYDSMISTANSSVACSASSWKNFQMPVLQEKWAHRQKSCSEHCKAIVKNLVEQVKVEAEQWSQMQEILDQVKAEMEELQAAKDYWEDRAHDADCQIQSLHAKVQECGERAASYKKKRDELQAQILILKEIKKMKNGVNPDTKEHKQAKRVSKEPQKETKLGVLVRRLKENHRILIDHGLKQKDKSRERRRDTLDLERSLLREIGNVNT